MGMFDRKKNDRERSLEIHIKNPTTNEPIVVYDFTPQMDIEDKNMMKAKAKFKNGDVFSICFRNPQNVSVLEMRNTGLFVRIG